MHRIKELEQQLAKGDKEPDQVAEMREKLHEEQEQLTRRESELNDKIGRFVLDMATTCKQLQAEHQEPKREAPVQPVEAENKQADNDAAKVEAPQPAEPKESQAEAGGGVNPDGEHDSPEKHEDPAVPAAGLTYMAESQMRIKRCARAEADNKLEFEDPVDNPQIRAQKLKDEAEIHEHLGPSSNSSHLLPKLTCIVVAQLKEMRAKKANNDPAEIKALEEIDQLRFY